MLMRAFLVIWLLLAPAAVWAQDGDKGYLTNLLQDSLGGEGRDVQINGFAGAFSSAASIASITIADNEGIWLTLEDVVIDWNRSALLRGRIEVEQLSARRIDLARLPVAAESELPAAEATPFALPELPVSINIATLVAETITLGAPVLGEDVALTLTASGQLANGEGDIKLNATRTDGKTGAFDVDAGYAAADQALRLALNMREEAGGIAARLLDVPGDPSVELRLNGTGPLNDFTTELYLATDGEERLSGQIALAADEVSSPGAAPARSFTADIGGDVTALFAPQYRPFFGDDVQLVVSGQQASDGALALDALDLQTEALRLQGAVALNRDYWPTLMDISAQLESPDGSAVLLPLSGEETRIGSADFTLTFDSDDDNRWAGVFDVTGLERSDVSITQTKLAADGVLEGNVNAIGQVSAAVTFDTNGIAFADASLSEAVGQALSGTLDIAFVEGQPLRLSGLNLSGADYGLTGDAVVNDLDSGFNTDFDVALKAQDLSRFAAISGQMLEGAADVALQGSAALGGIFDIKVTGGTTALAIGQAQADAVLAGRTTLALTAVRDTTGTSLKGLDIRNAQIALTGDARLETGRVDATFDMRLADAALLVPDIEGPLSVTGSATQDAAGVRVDVDATAPNNVTASVDGLVTGPQARVAFLANIPEINAFVPDYRGAAKLEGVAFQSPLGWRLDTDVNGPYGLVATVEGRVTGDNAPDVAFDAKLPSITPFAPQYSGPLAVAGTAKQGAEGISVDVKASGPYGADATVIGRVTGENSPDITFDANLPNIRPLAPQFNGPLSVAGTAKQTGDTLSVDTNLSGPYGLTAQVAGDVTGPAPAVTYVLNLPNVAPVVPQFSGPLRLDGTARQQGANWFVDTAVAGPAGTTADVVGRVGTDGTLGLSVAGNAPLALANPFLEPRSIQGQSRFDLRIDGPAALGSVSGQISTSDGRLSAPNFRVALTDIAANIGLAQGRASIDMRAAVSSGGTLTVNGPVTLTGAIPANLNIALTNVEVVDPALYRTTLNGGISVNGNLTGGARIAGRIDVGETDVSVPSSGLGGFTIIPQIAHVGASAAVRQTQGRAGLNKPEETSSSSSGAAYPLDILVSAPSRIFVRGRGLDAELGGTLRLTGTTANIISSGQFELIRGRLDILEKRFELDEGTVQLQGNFDPFLRFVATTRTSVGTASVIIEGPASEPQVRFESSPEAPQDEVLAQIFFGRDASQLSAFQALQLANAVATLAGNGGEGIVSKLRKSFDLDDLDITTDEDGNAGLRAGKYLSDNVYTDVTVGGTDGAEVSINIDLTPSLTARGTATATGDTSIGIYFEKDY